MYFFLCILLTFGAILVIFSYRKTFWFFVYVIIYCVGMGITTLMFISDGLDRTFFWRKMEKTRSMKGEMHGEVFFSRQDCHFSFVYNMIKVLFPICTLNWRVDNYVSSQGKGINRKNEGTLIIRKIVAFSDLY